VIPRLAIGFVAASIVCRVVAGELERRSARRFDLAILELLDAAGYPANGRRIFSGDVTIVELRP
jgi:hypothetical protein